MKRVLVSLCVMMLLSSAALSAPPATKPAKPDPNSVEESFEDLGFKFWVPKAWKQSVKNPHGATFQLPGGAFIVLAGKVKPDSELKPVVEATKKNLGETVKGFRLVKDEATTLGGQDAWLLVYDAQLTAKEVDPKTGKQLGEGRTVTVTNRTMQVVAVHDGVQVQLVFSCGDKAFDALSKNGQRVIGTFEWTGSPKPAEEKK